MSVWADPPLSRREARLKGREEAGAEPVVVSEDELAAAVEAEEAARFGDSPVVRRTGAGGRRAQWSPPAGTSAFAPQHFAPPETEDNTPESQDEVAPELTMTRRELRALRERAVADGHAEPGIVFLPFDDGAERAAAEPPAVVEVMVEPDAADATAAPDVIDAADAPDAPDAPDVVDAPEAADVVDAADGGNAPAAQSAEPIPELIEPSSADWTFRALRRARTASPTGAGSLEGTPVADSALDADANDTSDDELEYIEAELVEDNDDANHHDANSHDADTHDADHDHADERSESSAPAQDSDEPSGAVPETLSPFDALFRAPVSESAEPSTSTEPGSKPYGHWTTQAALDDVSPTGAGFLSRDVGVTTGAITTSALVLPSIPESGAQLLAPLTNTGEIMVTGSIDLPRTFGSTGAHPARFDHPDVDALLEESDREDAVSTSAPVRAIRAVSSTSSTRGVIEPPAKPKSKLPLIGGIILGGIILVVGAFVAAALVFNGV